jgi:hypothetical protein
VPAPAEPETPSPDGLRASALQRLLPPLVHRLNNSLAVLQGVHELGARADRAERELVRVHLAHLGLALARVGLFAREPSALARRLPLAELAAGLTLLLAPYAESRGVALELELDATGTLEVDGLFEGLLVAAVCELIARRGAEAGPVPRVRVSARPAARALLVALGSSARPEHAPALQALADHARARGWPASLRGAARAVVLRLAVPAAALAPAPARHPRNGARVLLLCGPGEERELVEMLLREHGFGVVAMDEPPAGGVFDLALVERLRTDADPELAARLTARYGLARVVPLEPSPRPDELLHALGAESPG